MDNTRPDTQVNKKIPNSKKYFSGGIVAFQVILGKIFHSSSAGLFLSQAMYWSDKGQGKEEPGDGWFYKSRDEWWDETSLSYDEQLTARMKLKSAGVLEEHNKKLIHRLYYRVNFDALDSLIERYHDNPPKSGKSPETGKALLGGFQQVSPNLNILETSSQQSEGLKSEKPPISSLSPETGNPLVGEREIPSSYTHRLPSKTTKKEREREEKKSSLSKDNISDEALKWAINKYGEHKKPEILHAIDKFELRYPNGSCEELKLWISREHCLQPKALNTSSKSETSLPLDNYQERVDENLKRRETDLERNIFSHIASLIKPENYIKDSFPLLKVDFIGNASITLKHINREICRMIEEKHFKSILKAVQVFVPTVKSVEIMVKS